MASFSVSLVVVGAVRRFSVVNDVRWRLLLRHSSNNNPTRMTCVSNRRTRGGGQLRCDLPLLRCPREVGCHRQEARKRRWEDERRRTRQRYRSNFMNQKLQMENKKLV
ncbi:hypothetical protein HN51_022688 [Arachis hypogaea]